MLLHVVSQGTMLVAHPSRALQSQDRWAIVICFPKHRVRIHDPVAMLDLQRTETILIAQLQSGWQLAELGMTNIVPLTMPGGRRGIGLKGV